MKKSFYKIISVILCAVLLNISIISSMSVKSYCDEVNAVEWLYDHFTDAVSAIGGFIYNDGLVPVWNGWKTLLGLNTDEDLEQYVNDNVFLTGRTNGGYDVRFTDQFKNDLDRFNKYYQDENTDFRYAYSYDIDQFSNFFASRQRYQAIRNLLNANKSKTVLIFGSSGAFTADPTGNNDVGSIAGGGNNSIQICVIDNPSCFVINLINTGGYDGYIYLYNDDWQRIRWEDSGVTFYGFSSRGDLTLSQLNSVPMVTNSTFPINNTLVRFVNDYQLINGFISGSPVWVSYDVQSRPTYRNDIVMKNYSLGNLPYYQVPMNPNVSYINGSYNTTSEQLDNSITYGDISSYVEDNSVTEYSTVINYINNYYGSGSGGSGGSGSGGSGSDIDWSWLGTIGEVIGGLISALGNVISGIIEGITSLITSLTESLPNVFGSIWTWLLPFLPEELTSLLSLMILAIVIVGTVRLIRGK